MAMKVYPTHEDRRAILERRLEIAREQNDKLKADIGVAVALLREIQSHPSVRLYPTVLPVMIENFLSHIDRTAR